MSASAAPDRTNPAPAPAPGLDPGVADQLPADAYYHLIRTLRLTLPPPPDDSPEALLRRDHAAIASIARLTPANAAEANLAAQFVAASEQWKDCLRLAQKPETTPAWAMKCRAQATSMMRQSNSALRLLLCMQDARRKLEADNAACDRLAWTEHCAIALMAEALSPRPHPDPLPEGEGEGAAPPPPLGEGERAKVPPAQVPAYARMELPAEGGVRVRRRTLFLSHRRRSHHRCRARRTPRPSSSPPPSAIPPPIPSGPRRSAARGGSLTARSATPTRPRPRSCRR